MADDLSSAEVHGATDSLGWAWSIHKAKHSRLCSRCRHAEWQHEGVEGEGCTHLGTCPCARFSKVHKV